MTARPDALVRLGVQPRVAGLSLADVRTRLAAVVACVVLLGGTPAFAEHLTLDPGARTSAPRPFDADVNVRVDDDGFHIGGRLFGLGVWLRGRTRDRGVTIDGQIQRDKTYNFRLDADTERGIPRLRIETYPGTL